MSKVAVITGITGQIGSELAEYLINKDYVVHGIVRRASTINTQRIDHLYNNPNILDKTLFLHYGDLADGNNLDRLMREIQPDEVYNLGAQSHVQVSWEVAEYTADVVAVGTLRLLEAVRNCGKSNVRFLQMSSSEMFGGFPDTAPQNENTPFHPRSPYGVSKLFGYWMAINFRESYGMFVSNSITFNTEGVHRGETFVTKKISKAVANIKAGKQEILQLGNIYAKRDWTMCSDTIDGLWRILQHDHADDFVLGSSRTNTIKEFCEEAFNVVGINLVWTGTGIDEKAFNADTGKCVVEINPKYFRPAEVDLLYSNASKAREELEWEPKVSFKELVKIMVEYDLAQVKL